MMTADWEDLAHAVAKSIACELPTALYKESSIFRLHRGSRKEPWIRDNDKYGGLYKQTPWPLVRKRAIPTDDRRLSAKFSVNFCGWGGQRGEFPKVVNLNFSRPEPLFLFQVAPQLS
jgi:hypothetical protein